MSKIKNGGLDQYCKV